MNDSQEQQAMDAINDTVTAIMPQLHSLGERHDYACVGSVLSFIMLNLLMDDQGRLTDNSIDAATEALRVELRHIRDTSNFQFRSVQ